MKQLQIHLSEIHWPWQRSENTDQLQRQNLPLHPLSIWKMSILQHWVKYLWWTETSAMCSHFRHVHRYIILALTLKVKKWIINSANLSSMWIKARISIAGKGATYSKISNRMGVWNSRGGWKNIKKYQNYSIMNICV